MNNLPCGISRMKRNSTIEQLRDKGIEKDGQEEEKVPYDEIIPGSPKRKRTGRVCENRRPKIRWKKDFSYAEIHAATEGFSQTKFLSEGGFGSVCRGDLNGQAFAVKQHNGASFQGEK
ncbi:hypothetical protein SADUNF_Sadunf01G0028200 [Salix dunnii]|uniref:non-specific serine/threonine protein kinase n=1 Tax=Salix dunnii TaxID=1413687 RepID=A0A835N9N7_9ROSI|nr:hypothetical protein SADUNF_Sadunf01G0028200 [Salix dunnii]